ncbi:MAG: Flagellar motor switch protein FliN [Holosporales bacterium]
MTDSFNPDDLFDGKIDTTGQMPEKELSAKEKSSALEAVYDVPIQISAVLGRATMPVHQLLKLGRGAVVELDKRVGESIDIYVNNKLVARGEVVVVDERIGITMTEIVKTER